MAGQNEIRRRVVNTADHEVENENNQRIGPNEEDLLLIKLWKMLTENAFGLSAISELFTSIFQTLVLTPLRKITSLNGTISSEDAAQEFKAEVQRILGGSDSKFLFASFLDALKRCKEDDRLLIFYFHSKHHEMSEEFLRSLMNCVEFQQLLEDDLHLSGGSVEHSQAYHLKSAISLSSFPSLAILAPAVVNDRMSSKLIRKIEPADFNYTLPPIISEIKRAKQKHSIEVQQRLAQDFERNERTRLREEQDREFEEARQRDLEIQRQREAAENAEKEKARRLERFRAEFAEEPTQGARIKINFPKGKTIVRRFDPAMKVQSLFDFLEFFIADSADLQIENFAVVCNFPKKQYERDSAELQATLEEEKLAPQCVLFVQDLDS